MDLKQSIDSILMRHDLCRNEYDETVEQLFELFEKNNQVTKNSMFTNEEVFNILQKRLQSIGIFPSFKATQIWFRQYKKL
jgi:hypothetical protein